MAFLTRKAQRISPDLPADITLELTTDERIRVVKQLVFGIDEVTDVVTVSYDPMPGIPESAHAELFVNAYRAHTRAPQRKGWSQNHELALYLAHSLDHLAGKDDATEQERQSMRRRDLRWVHDAGNAGLLIGLFVP
jgi:rRNA maturation RNase YbeY